MDNLRTVLKALYLDFPYSTIRKKLPYFNVGKKGHKNALHNLYSFDEKQEFKFLINQCLKAYHKTYTDSEQEAATDSVSEKCLYFPHCKNDIRNIHKSLLHFTNEVLCIKKDSPTVRFEHLFRWHEMTLLLGEDLFTTAHLAYKDFTADYKRKKFAWPLVAYHDNITLNGLTDEGISDLHFHLKGSSANFELNWLALMNHISLRGKTFDKMSVSLDQEYRLFDGQSMLSMHQMSIDAACIRFFFFLLLNGEKGDNFNWKKATSEIYTSSERASYVQNQLSLYKNILNKRHPLDYAIDRNISIEDDDDTCYSESEKCNFFMSGERGLMYRVFRNLYANKYGDKTTEYSYLFFSYLLIKAKFRREIIQVNQDKGFANFSKYEERKELFIEDYPKYKEELIRYAVKGSLNRRGLNYLEARITPGNDSGDLAKKISKNERAIQHIQQDELDFFERKQCDEKLNYNYILHFIKLKEKNESCDFERHHQLRHKVKKQALAFIAFKEKYKKKAKKVVALDAANSELFCRPEVFAQAYRYAKMHNDIHYTFHAGEDYIDLVDGLRAIDESIIFLNLKRGDRLGHALALGVDACSYYERKHYTIAGEKQCLLDNMIWVFHRAEECGIAIEPQLSYFLKRKIEKLRHEIGYTCHDFNVQTYYSAMLLRGDSPWCNEGEYKKRFPLLLTWDEADFNHHKKAEEARNDTNAHKLYNEYHFNLDIKKNGDVCTEIIFPKSYAGLVYELQEAMIREIEDLNIAIECNPTSNYKIGSLGRYDKHPIFRFYNEGIKAEGERTNNLSVSINTDDQGVFATSLPNEYALLALALEKKKDKEGNPLYTKYQIRQWLDSVRLFSKEQRFDKN